MRLSDKQVEEGFDLVQFVQFDDIEGIEDAEIAWNKVVNEPGKSRVEDNISIYQTHGMADHPIRIHDNCIVGGYTIDPARATWLRLYRWNTRGRPGAGEYMSTVAGVRTWSSVKSGSVSCR